jgi:DNA modification methylase
MLISINLVGLIINVFGEGSNQNKSWFIIKTEVWEKENEPVPKFQSFDYKNLSVNTNKWDYWMLNSIDEVALGMGSTGEGSIQILSRLILI